MFLWYFFSNYIFNIKYIPFLKSLNVFKNMDWFIFSIAATILFSLQNILYKATHHKNANKYLVTLYFMITVEILALISFLINGGEITNLGITILLGFLFALFFNIKTISQLKALESLPTNVVFPITSSSSVVLIMIFSIFFLGESLSLKQIIGISIIVIFVNLTYLNSKKSLNNENKQNLKTPSSLKQTGYLYVLFAIIPGFLMVVVNKFASSLTNISFFIVVTYFFSIIISLVMHNINKRSDIKKYSSSKSLKLGILIGLINFGGTFFYLTALKLGPLSLISAIHVSSLIIVAFFGKILYGENLNFRKIIFILFVIFGILLIKI